MSKVTVPGTPRWAVARPRITDLIARGAHGPLTTVVGPPGAGKTMATAMWADDPGFACTVAWVTLDSFDNQPRVFWSYVVAALRRAGVDVPRVSPAPGQAAAVEHGFLLRLASVLAAQAPPVVLVLDDLHLLAAAAPLEELAYVLRNARRGLHVVVASRADPLLPLHRYRLIGELAEIRADDLALRVPEATSLLSHHGVTLSAHALQSLTGRTEGWAAGIRLAALSLVGHPDPEQFVKELDAEDSAITAYLVDEVLDAQPPAVRGLLLRTSILDSMSADLASELAGNGQAGAMLATLVGENAFVRPLGHGWYRYHALFAAVLRLKLRRDCPAEVPALYRRAARWYQHSGQLDEAVRYAAESGDWPFAGQLVITELAVSRLLRPRGTHALGMAFQSMPQQVAWTQPHPLLVRAALELASGAAGPSRGSLTAAEAMLGQLPAAEEVPARLAAALIQSALACRTGDTRAAEAAARSAGALLASLPESVCARNPGIGAEVLLARGAAELLADRPGQAVATFGAGLITAGPDAVVERADCLGYLALMAALHGDLNHASELVTQAVEVTESSSSSGLEEHLPPAATVAQALVHLERNEMPRAHNQLRLADAALRIAPDRVVNAVGGLVAAEGRLAEGRATAAVEMIRHLRLGWSPPAWLDAALALLESRAWVAIGDIGAAVAAARRAEPSAPAGTTIAMAEAKLAAGDHRAAQLLLRSLDGNQEEVPAPLRLARWLADARLGYATGDEARGQRALRQALRAGLAQQARLPFILARGWLRPVLRSDPGLAQAFHGLVGPGAAGPPRASLPAGVAAPQQAAPLVVEQPSEREREVLGHLANMLSTAEIATEMYISVNTVKTHLRSIYRKLSVTHRSEAVRRARQLRLI